MSEASTRLFIVDQTLKDYQGHHFEYDAAIAEAAEAAGLEAVIVANKAYKTLGGEASDVVPWYHATWYDSSANGKHAHTFWSETLDLLQNHAATPDDIVLIHTVSLAEFAEIVSYHQDLMWRDIAGLPTIYVILRRDPDEFTPPALDALKTKLKRVYGIPDLSRRLLLCTDTEPLREAWSDALGQPVLTLPIPFRHALVDRAERPRDPKAPLQIVYLGDARTEKGYQHFPNMTQALWQDYIQPGRVEITLQSNYNMPGGEGGIPQARLKLLRYPHGVTLTTELLEPDVYYALLAKADIIVLPYEPQPYGRRSSGVLNEAIAAGKVAVVPEETWLATQVSADRGVVYRHPSGAGRRRDRRGRELRRALARRRSLPAGLPPRTEPAAVRSGAAAESRPDRATLVGRGSLRDGRRQHRRPHRRGRGRASANAGAARARLSHPRGVSASPRRRLSFGRGNAQLDAQRSRGSARIQARFGLGRRARAVLQPCRPDVRATGAA